MRSVRDWLDDAPVVWLGWLLLGEPLALPVAAASLAATSDCMDFDAGSVDAEVDAVDELDTAWANDTPGWTIRLGETRAGCELTLDAGANAPSGCRC